jgi:hypothetical protein
MTLHRDKPILGVVGFNLFTLLVFVTAPVQWQTGNLVELCVFVVLCQMLVLLGFGLGRERGDAAPPVDKPPFFRADTLMLGLFAIYILTFPISYAYRLEFAPFDIAGMVNRLMAGIQDPHASYASTLERTSRGPIPWTVYFAISIFNQVFFAAGFLYWRQFKRSMKIVFAILVGIELFYWVGIATGFGVVALATTAGLSTMFWPARRDRWQSRRTVGNLVLLAVLLFGTIAFFSYNLYRRSNFAQIDVASYQVARAPLILDHPAFSVIPRPLWPTYVLVVSYLGQGYYHTCFAFDLDFRSTGMLGNNPALISLASLFGVDVWDDTYMHRLQRKSIDEYGVWHSAYTWFASDVSFYGVPILMFFLGYFFGFSWAQGLQGDFLSRLVFIMFGNVLLFLFANNTYLASVFYAFMFFVPLWVLTRFSGLGLGARTTRLVFDQPVQ